MANVGTLNRWMMFVDGENLTLRGQAYANDRGIPIGEGRGAYMKDVFLWMPSANPRSYFGPHAATPMQPAAVRAYYYTSLVGDDPRQVSVREALRALGFDPQVFKKDKGQAKSKGVDITLTKDILSHGFQNNYDVAVLVAGDADYVPLVREVKRIGKVVITMFFSDAENGLSQQLRLESDQFVGIEQDFTHRWRQR
jgi:hypothetical protein